LTFYQDIRLAGRGYSWDSGKHALIQSRVPRSNLFERVLRYAKRPAAYTLKLELERGTQPVALTLHLAKGLRPPHGPVCCAPPAPIRLGGIKRNHVATAGRRGY